MPASYVSPRFVALDDKGKPLVGARLYTYANKSTTPKVTYRDASGSAANTNPVILDANGSAVLYLTGNELYTFVLKDQFDVLLWTQDDILGQLDLDALDDAVSEATKEANEAAARASADAERAEAAADAATLASGLYPDTNTIINGGNGFPPVPEGHFATVPSQYQDGFLDLYQVVSGVAVYVDTYPSRAAIDAVIRLASLPGTLDGEFHSSDNERLLAGLVDDSNNLLAAVDVDGFEIVQPRADFYSTDAHPAGAAYAISGEDDSILMAVDSEGQPMHPWIADFFVSDTQPDYCYADETGVMYLAWLNTGEFVIGGGGGGGSVDWGSIPASSQHVSANLPWSSNRSVQVQRSYGPLYSGLVSGKFPNYEALYSYLDGLMAENSDYISKSLLGNDEWGNPIYQYTMSTAQLQLGDWTEAETAPPKIVVVGGTHAWVERESVLTNTIIMREICDLWREDAVLAALRWQCDIVWVPMINPSGYNLRTNLNGNGINLNRDTNSTAPQLETLIGMGLPDTYPDAIAFIDHHNAYEFERVGRTFWLGTRREETLGVCLEVCRHMGQYSRQEFDFWPQDNRPLTRVSKNLEGTFCQYWQDIKGRDGYLAETPRDSAHSIIDLRRFNTYGFKQLLFAILQRELRHRAASMAT